GRTTSSARAHLPPSKFRAREAVYSAAHGRDSPDLFRVGPSGARARDLPPRRNPARPVLHAPFLEREPEGENRRERTREGRVRRPALLLAGVRRDPRAPHLDRRVEGRERPPHHGGDAQFSLRPLDKKDEPRISI